MRLSSRNGSSTAEANSEYNSIAWRSVPASFAHLVLPPTPPFTPPVSCYQWTTKIGSAIGGAFLAAAIITGSIDNPDIFDLSRYWHLWLIAASYQPMGTSFGFILSSVFGLGPEDMRAVGIETGVQSYALVISVISTSFTGCQVRACVLPLSASLCFPHDPTKCGASITLLTHHCSLSFFVFCFCFTARSNFNLPPHRWTVVLHQLARDFVHNALHHRSV